MEGSKHLCMHEEWTCRVQYLFPMGTLASPEHRPCVQHSRRERAEQLQHNDKSSLHFSRAGWPLTRIPSRADWRVRHGAMPGRAGRLAKSLTDSSTRAGEGEMDLQLSGHASRPLTVVACPLNNGEGFEGACFPSPMILKTRAFLPRVSSYLPSGVEAEKFPGARFHQSCPYRNTGMGAVERPSSCRTYLRVGFREFERLCHAARNIEG